MRAGLKVSILLNAVLSGGLIYILINQQPKESASAIVSSAYKPAAQAAAISDVPQPSASEPASFHWSQLVSGKDYRLYVANLRAIGCPEPTIEDIVRGDTDRAFSWERSQLGLDGSGNGPWSQAREMQLVASLLRHSSGVIALAQSAENPAAGNTGTEVVIQRPGASGEARQIDGSEAHETAVPAQGAATATSYPLFLQNVNWSALGFTADQQSAIAQVRQQFQGEVNTMNQSPGNAPSQNAGASSNPNANNSGGLTQWQTALQSADDQLQALLGAQGYAAYEQQQYYAWYQPQVLASAGAGLTIDPHSFSLK